MPALPLPDITRNGTHPNELVGQQLRVLNALRNLRVELNNAQPNPRDYSVDAFVAAQSHCRAELLYVELCVSDHKALAQHASDHSRFTEATS